MRHRYIFATTPPEDTSNEKELRHVARLLGVSAKATTDDLPALIKERQEARKDNPYAAYFFTLLSR